MPGLPGPGPLELRVGTFRDVGLEARWGRTRSGRPVILLRDPASRLRHQRTRWWTLTRPMLEAMESKGIRSGFDSATLLGDVFFLDE